MVNWASIFIFYQNTIVCLCFIEEKLQEIEMNLQPPIKYLVLHIRAVFYIHKSNWKSGYAYAYFEHLWTFFSRNQMSFILF